MVVQTSTLPADVPRARTSTLSREISREWVHKLNGAEVYVTDVHETGLEKDAFVVFAQLPARHPFYGDRPATDPLLLAEIVRQAGLAVSHAGLGVPLGHQFLMWDLGLGLRPAASGADEDGRLAISVMAQLRAPRTAGPLAGCARTDLEFTVHHRGAILATASIGFDAVPPARYHRLRVLPAIIEPPAAAADGITTFSAATVGRRSPADVVIGRDEQARLRLRPCISNPVLYDHDVDHVPGIVIVEAMRQATLATCGTDTSILGLSVSFRRYVEHHQPCELDFAHDSAGPEPKVRVRLIQAGRTAAAGTLRLDRRRLPVGDPAAQIDLEPAGISAS